MAFHFATLCVGQFLAIGIGDNLPTVNESRGDGVLVAGVSAFIEAGSIIGVSIGHL
mgnify:CR=1 FL=1